MASIYTAALMEDVYKRQTQDRAQRGAGFFGGGRRRVPAGRGRLGSGARAAARALERREASFEQRAADGAAVGAEERYRTGAEQDAPCVPHLLRTVRERREDGPAAMDERCLLYTSRRV